MNLGPLAKERRLTETFYKALKPKDGDEVSSRLNESLEHVAQRIREEDAAMNTLGRRVADLKSSESSESSSAPLSDQELRSLKKYVKNRASSAHR
jgi:hypothetical protein